MTLALSMHACVCARMRVRVCLVHVHAYTADHTTHSLTRFVDSGVFVPDCIIMECGAPLPHRAVRFQWPSALLSVSPGPLEVLLGTTGGWGKHIHMCVCACTYHCTRVNRTQDCICHVTSCETHPSNHACMRDHSPPTCYPTIPTKLIYIAVMSVASSASPGSSPKETRRLWYGWGLRQSKSHPLHLPDVNVQTI